MYVERRQKTTTGPCSSLLRRSNSDLRQVLSELASRIETRHERYDVQPTDDESRNSVPHARSGDEQDRRSRSRESRQSIVGDDVLDQAVDHRIRSLEPGLGSLQVDDEGKSDDDIACRHSKEPQCHGRLEVGGDGRPSGFHESEDCAPDPDAQLQESEQGDQDWYNPRALGKNPDSICVEKLHDERHNCAVGATEREYI